MVGYLSADVIFCTFPHSKPTGEDQCSKGSVHLLQTRTSIDTTNARYMDLQNNLSHYYEIVKANREELYPSEELLNNDESTGLDKSSTGEIILDMI